MKIDTHGLNFKEAKEYILSSINMCYNRGYGMLEIIHGYNRGTRIKEWIRNANILYVSNVMASLTNSGVTFVYIKKKLC